MILYVEIKQEHRLIDKNRIPDNTLLLLRNIKEIYPVKYQKLDKILKL